MRRLPEQEGRAKTSRVSRAVLEKLFRLRKLAALERRFRPVRST